jgi:hypothetical protein
MADKNKLIVEIESFIQRDKFSAEAWDKRGLNPSSPELCAQLNSNFNFCATKLIDAINHNASAEHLVAIINDSLNRLDKNDYDTEEKEFIGDLFFELAKNINIDLGKTLDEWLYGAKILPLINSGRKVIETLRQPCTNCGKELETHIMQMEDGIPDHSWLIGKCFHCNELNLITLKPDINEFRFGNYEMITSLNKEDFSYEQALAKLLELKAALRKD